MYKTHTTTRKNPVRLQHNHLLRNTHSKNIEISIVIPIYNEEQNIPTLYYRLQTVLTQLKKTRQIIFVDDGSKDNSFNEMLKLKENDRNIRIIKFRRNFGQTAAFDAGFKHANGDIIIVILKSL